MPDTVKANEEFEAKFAMVFTTLCDKLKRVDEEREGKTVRFDFIKCLDPDAICATALRYDTLKRNLLFNTPGKYTIIVNDSAHVKEIEVVDSF